MPADEPYPWEVGGTLPPLGFGPIGPHEFAEHLRAQRHHIRGMESVIQAQGEIAERAVRATERVRRSVLIASGTLCATLIGSVITLVVSLHGGR